MVIRFSKKDGPFEMRKINYLLFLAIGFLLVQPTSAYANAISPFAQMVGLRLYVGNLIIGLVEGVVISWLFKARAGRTILLLILANYVSSWVGYGTFTAIGSLYRSNLALWVTIENVHVFVWLLILSAWLISIVIEFPFILMALAKNKKRIKQSLIASIFIQTLSYSLLLPFNSPFKHFCSELEPEDVVSVKQMVPIEGAIIYYLSAKDGDLYRIRTDGTAMAKIADLNIKNIDHELMAQKTESENKWKFFVVKPIPWQYPEIEIIQDTGVVVTGHTVTDSAIQRGSEYPVFDFRKKEDIDYLVATYNLGDTWLSVNELSKKERSRYGDQILRLQFDRFILHWHSRNASILPNGQIIYQIGEQIVLLKVEDRQMALVTHGRSPVIFLNQK